MNSTLISYEFPLNERMRIFIRLEQLFLQLDHFLSGTSVWDRRATVSTLVDILQVFTRHDLKAETLKELERHSNRLNQISIDNWSVPQQIDWYIVRAEMNGYDFNYKILQPWIRDPAYYQTIWMNQSDVPAHEGPTNHGTLEFWTYKFPLTNIEEKHLKDKLKIIPIFLEQARGNLTGNARDLWIAGIENFKQQIENLKKISEKFNESKSNSDILDGLKNAKKATKDFIAWLEEEFSQDQQRLIKLASENDWSMPNVSNSL